MQSGRQQGSQGGGGNQFSPENIPRDLIQYIKQYADENPSAFAGWCFVTGFVLGWRLKPW
jgi:hypothetical protein